MIIEFLKCATHCVVALPVLPHQTQRARNTPFLQIMKLRLREVKQLDQGHTAVPGKSQDWYI